MAYDYRKDEKGIYAPAPAPSIVTVGPQVYVCVRGAGDPNGADFGMRVELLYALSYAIRMMPKSGYTPAGFDEYAVYPLEGLWDLADAAKGRPTFSKDELVYAAMIRQPAFVTADVFARAKDIVRRKKHLALLEQASLEIFEDGLSVQMMHLGPYDAEPASFAKMDAFIAASGLEPRTLVHREIYLSDACRTAPEKMRTILRRMVRPAQAGTR